VRNILIVRGGGVGDNAVMADPMKLTEQHLIEKAGESADAWRLGYYIFKCHLARRYAPAAMRVTRIPPCSSNCRALKR
jgi:hypothetical protein